MQPRCQVLHSSRGRDPIRGSSDYLILLHQISPKKIVISESPNVEELDLRDNSDRVSPVEELILMVLDNQLLDRVIYIGFLLNLEPHKELIQFLK